MGGCASVFNLLQIRICNKIISASRRHHTVQAFNTQIFQRTAFSSNLWNTHARLCSFVSTRGMAELGPSNIRTLPFSCATQAKKLRSRVHSELLSGNLCSVPQNSAALRSVVRSSCMDAHGIAQVYMRNCAFRHAGWRDMISIPWWIFTAS